MKISATIHYAIVIMTDMAMQKEGMTVTADDIARRQNISFAFVSQILNKLKHSGLVESIRGGVSGGFRLKDSPSKISVRMIIDAVEPDFCICPSEQIETGQSVDNIIRFLWKRVSAETKKSLSKITLENLSLVKEEGLVIKN